VENVHYFTDPGHGAEDETAPETDVDPEGEKVSAGDPCDPLNEEDEDVEDP